MKYHQRPTVIIVVGSLLAVLAAACATNAPEPASAPLPTAAAPIPTAETGESPSPSPAPTTEPYDSNAAMYRIFTGFNSPNISSQSVLDATRRERDQRLQVLEEIKKEGDLSQVPVMLEIMRFLRSDQERDAIADVLQELTGQDLGGDDWFEWTEWYGRNSDDFPPPSEYIDWKINLLSQISSRFAEFLRPAKEFSRINVTEIQWGGVLPDGIPDLQSPPHVPADEATYLGFDERVFGISINGEHRAYPLRITNPHEMVNDTLGGEPIALSW